MLRQRCREVVWCSVVAALVAAGCGGSDSGSPVPGTDTRSDATDGGGGAGGSDGAPPEDVAPAESGVEMAPAEVAPVDTMMVPGGVKVMPTMGLKTTEMSAGQATFTVALIAQPTADVVITLDSDKLTEGTASPKTLTFTADNWNAPQTVTVTGVDDMEADGDAAYKIVLAPATSADPRYQGLNPDDVEVSNTDNESAGITVAPKPAGMPLVTTEMGGQATFTVVLNSKPTAAVMVPVSSADPTEGTATTTVNFTPENWNAPQTVTVTGADDMEADGAVTYKINVGPPTGADSKYAALAVVQVELSNTDNETAGITVVPPDPAVTTEAGGKVMFLVFLNSKPTANVTIGLSSSDTTEGTVAPASLVFTKDNWNAPQVVTATGVDDALSDGNQPYTVVTAATFSVDTNYNDLIVADVVLSNTDNDSAGITLAAPINGATSEAGRQVTFTVVLNSQPEADVVIPLSSSDEGEGTVSVATLTFTPSNWNAPQPVTVTGVDDFLADGSQPYSVVTGAAMSTDTKYSAVDAANVALTNTDNDTAGITVTAESFLTTTELGGTATFTIVLNSEPTGNVVVPLSSNDATEGTVSSASLIFTPVNWNAPQTVTITGINDLVADGNQIYSVVTAAAMSADNAYHGIDPPNVLLFNTDNDSAGVTVTAAALLTTTEVGGAAMFTIVLNSQPTANVTIGLAPSDATEGAVLPAAAIFTPSNWNTAQTVTVTGVDDAVADGAQPYTVVTGFAVSTDSAYNGIDVPDVNASNTDNDSAGITVTAAAGLTTTEAGATATFTVVLNSEPTASVTIGLTSSDTTEGTVAASLIFTAGNWNMPQTVTITGIDDALDDGNQPYTVVIAAAVSSDMSYSGVNPADVSVTNTDNDAAGVTVTAMAGLTVTEAAGAGHTATFTVVLNSEPTASVTIGITSSTPAQGTVAPASLVFTTANWNMAQTVTITGVDDTLDDGDLGFSIVTAAATSTDLLYNAVDPANVSVTAVDNDAAGITVTPTTGLTVTEVAGAGHTATFTVVLNSEPTASVTIGLTSSDIVSGGTVSPASLTFTTVNWATAQTVTVTGVNDALDDGNVAFFVLTGAATSTDSSYSGVNAADVSLTATDDDTAGITVTPTMGLTVTEAAGMTNTATFTVVLNSEPTVNVTVGLTSNDLTEGTVAPASVVFTPINWMTPQMVTVTGVDETLDDGNVMFSIVTAAATSGDTSYNGVNPADVTVTNTDNDVAAITVTASGPTVTEAAGPGHTATFTVVLASEPTASVTVGISSTDTVSGGTVSPASLVFTTGNWMTAQTVTITGVDDAIDDGDVGFSVVTAAATSTDPLYSGLNAADVAVGTTDDDAVGVTVAPATRTVTEAAGVGHTATFTVVLLSQPLTDVLIPIVSATPAEATVDKPFLSFTALDWNMAQTVTITAIDDAVDDGDTMFDIDIGPATGTGSGYAAFDPTDVVVTVTDDDP
jgi:hypothetical protein